jgi:hypothetical protein
MGSSQRSVNIDNSRPTFNDFVADLSVRSGLNGGTVRGSAIGRYLGIPGEGPTAAAGQHILTMSARTPARFEKTGIGNSWVSYVKSPGALCFVPAGVQFVMRALSD